MQTREAREHCADSGLCPVGLSRQAWLRGTRLLAPDSDQAASTPAPQLYFSLFFSYLSGFFVGFVFLKNLGCEATTGKGEGM